MSRPHSSSFNLQPVAKIHSCYREKFAIPRQPGLVKSATATVELLPPFNTPDALRGLEEFSHVWIIFVFHASADQPWNATVRPPRLGGNKRIGVFASRSNFRPNSIGLSVVELIGIEGTTLQVRGGDFLDGTPVLDIKPYIPYSDAINDACGAFANSPPEPTFRVQFSESAALATRQLEDASRPALYQLITDLLAYNPRPAYQKEDPNRIYGTRIFDLEVRWKQHGNEVEVIHVERSRLL